VGSQRLGQFGPIATDVSTKNLFEFAVTLDQSLKSFGETAAPGVEVFLQARRQFLSDLPLVGLE
jgi:hypothetical protein